MVIGPSLAGTSHFAIAVEPDETGTVSSIGPDVIVSSLAFSNIISYGYQNTLKGYITGLSIGTQSCNIGTEQIQWQDSPSVQHPVIRLSVGTSKDG